MTRSKRKRKSPAYSISFVIIVILLAIYGSIMVFSASYSYAEARFEDPFYFTKRHAIWLSFGMAVMMLSSKINVCKIRKITPVLYAVTLLLLILVLATGLVGNGAKRWISIGPLTIQPSEISKLTIILMLSYYQDRFYALSLSNDKRKSFTFGTLLPITICLIPIVLIMLQKHLSCIIIVSLISISLIICFGANLRYMLGFIGCGAVGILSLAFFTDYTKERIMVWLNPEAYKLTGGWQTLQGLMAIGSGGVFGVGLGKSLMKCSYVSEPANDMIFAILCEELGIAGAIVAMVLFALLVIKGIKIALNANDTYSRLTAIGISIKMAIQALLNIAVVTNSIPNTGISLPFFSYGGSSLVMVFFEMGLLLAISRNSKVIK